MTAHPVSTLVNEPANDDERCVEVDGNVNLQRESLPSTQLEDSK